jgi:hypothetical protein
MKQTRLDDERSPTSWLCIHGTQLMAELIVELRFPFVSALADDNMAAALA